MPPVEPIAIVGLACRLPGADSPDAFWELLVQGRDEISEVPADRWDIAALYDADTQAPGKVCTRWGGFLRDIDRFDAAFFSISPGEAERVDPQQRFILEVAWEALEDAWLSPQRLAGSDTGVFVAISHAEYSRLINSEWRRIVAYNGAGMYVSIAANRLSYSLDLRGPSMAIDTACSSSLVAVHVACQNLRARECSLAIVGAVNLNLDPCETMGLTKARVLSPDGRCKTFDDTANGYVRSDGCGVVILKRLADAVRDGDVIRAVIRGSAVNHDGLTNGLTAPSGPAQQAVIGRALEVAGVQPADVDYVEAHGTGTPLGDPIEMNSIMAVYGRERPAHKTCWVGAVKTNIGHLEAASGMAGLLKVVLALQHRSIPRNLHLSRINRYLKLEGKPFRIPTEMQPWPGNGSAAAACNPVLAAVSAFGFGGTNAHIIVSEAPSAPAPELAAEDDSGPQRVLALSARNDAALHELLSRYAALLGRNGEISLRDLCHSANRGRAHLQHRVAFLVDSLAELRRALEEFRAGRTGPRTFTGTSRQQPKLIFTFGAHVSCIGPAVRRLCAASTVFRDHFDECQRIFVEALSPPAGVRLGRPSFTSSAADAATAAEYEAASSYAIQYCTARLLGSWNIVPDVVCGRGNGELAAAAVAGLLSPAEGMRGSIVYARLRHRMAGNGARPAHLADQTDLRSMLSAAAVPCGQGPRAARATSAPRFFSRAAGKFDEQPFSDPAHWERLLAADSPPALNGGSLLAGKNTLEVDIDPDRVMATAASAYAAGVQVDWANFPGSGAFTPVKLPTYPFQRSRYWYETAPATAASSPAAASSSTAALPAAAPAGTQSQARPSWLLSAPLAMSAPSDRMRCDIAFGGERLSFLHDHRVSGRAIVPASALIEVAAATASDLDAASRTVRLSDIAFRRSCALPGPGGAARVAVELSGQTSPRVIRITDAESDAGAPYMLATLASPPSSHDTRGLDLARYGQPLMDAPSRYYAELGELGLQYGPSFRAIEALYVQDGECVAKVSLPQAAADGTDSFLCHPVLLDACFQVVGYAAAARLPISMMLPVSITEFTLTQAPAQELWCRVTDIKTGVGPTERGISADIQLFDSTLQAIGAVRGFTLAPLAAVGATRTASDLAEWQFDPVWHVSSDCGVAKHFDGRLLLANAPAALLEAVRPNCREVVRLESGLLNAHALQELAAQPTLAAVVYVPRPQLSQPLQSTVSHGELLVEEARELWTLIRALTEGQGRSNVRVMLATTSAHSMSTDDLTTNPLHTALWGLGRSIAAEHPGLDIRLVDFDAIDAQALLKELQTTGPRHQSAWRSGRRYELSLRRRTQMQFPAAEPFRAALRERGDPDSWVCVPEAARELLEGEVRVAVAAVGLNFRDVLTALGRLRAPGEDAAMDARDIPFGGECAGTVVGVGSAVTGLRAGDEVIVALTPACLATTVIAMASRVLKKPASLSSLQAATVSTAFLTAYYAMDACAPLRSGQRVLVHAAAGAVGQACCQLALRRGVEVFATASRRKWAFLRQQGISHVLDSRNPDFWRATTNGSGPKPVDVVINSLSGDFTASSLDALRPGGTFIEIGKAGVWSEAQVAGYRPDVTYRKFDLLEVADREPEVLATLLERIRADLGSGAIRPLPLRAFGLEEVGRAFRYLASGRHIGKVVIEMPDTAASTRPAAAGQPSLAGPLPLPFSNQGSYLITGAFGSLGLELAQWAAAAGCRDLVLLGRNPPSAAAEATLERLRQAGCEVRVQVADVADPAAVEQLFAGGRSRGRPITGVFHLAGVTRDATFANTTDEDLRQVLQPKVAGLWNLHRASRADDLEMFVCFSSASSQIGPQGQASYAAANAFMDGLMAHRAQAGLPALSINWGPVGDLAVAGSRAPALRDYLMRSGLRLMESQACFALLERYLRRRERQVMVLPFSADADSSAERPGANRRLLATFENLPAREPAPQKNQRPPALRGLSSGQARAAIGTTIKSVLAEALHLDSSTMVNEASLIDLGVDSLLAMEIVTKLEAQFGVTLPDALDVQSGSILEVTRVVGDRLAQAGLLDGPMAGGEQSDTSNRDPGPERPGTGNRDSGAARPARNGAMQLFCFHHLGGGASIYRDWLATEAPGLDIQPIELPGRGTRLREPFVSTFQGLLVDLTSEVRRRLRGPFALYGHSMGALVAYEMARHLEEELQLQPARLFVGGLWAPHRHNDALAQRAFTISNAIRQAEIPQQVLQDPDAMGRLNRIFEADARLFQSYRWVERPPAPLPITVFGGQADPVASEDDLVQWQHCTRGDFAVRMVPGGHLFIKQSGQLVLDLISGLSSGRA